ncbi:MAG: hypothetical protein AAFV07_07940 [Bacteroidota bacterium]
MSSVAKGKISKVSPDGTIELFADSPDLVSTLGMEVDAVHDRLLVCVTDPGFNASRSDSTTLAQLAAVAIYDLKSGERTDFIQLASGAPHLANDLILDDVGNVYVSDSFDSTIYKIDVSGQVSVLVSDGAFSPQPMNFGLNGIVWHPDGYLIAAKYDEGKLFRIPLEAPAAFQEIKISNGAIPAIDGILLTDNQTLAVASNNLGPFPHENAVYELTSTDNWANASITQTIATGNTSFPTTFTQVGPALYVQYARLQALVAGNNPPATDFPIVKINF